MGLLERVNKVSLMTFTLEEIIERYFFFIFHLTHEISLKFNDNLTNNFKIKMDIKTQYVLQSKLSFYHTPKFYEDTNGNTRRSNLRRV